MESQEFESETAKQQLSNEVEMNETDDGQEQEQVGWCRDLETCSLEHPLKESQEDK